MNRFKVPLPEGCLLEKRSGKLSVIKDRKRRWKIHFTFDRTKKITVIRYKLEIWAKKEKEQILEQYENWKSELEEKLVAWTKETQPTDTLRMMFDLKKYFHIQEEKVKIRKNWKEEWKSDRYDVTAYCVRTLLDAYVLVFPIILLFYLPVGLALDNVKSLVYVPLLISSLSIVIMWLYQLYRVLFNEYYLEDIWWHFKQKKVKK